MPAPTGSHSATPKGDNGTTDGKEAERTTEYQAGAVGGGVNLTGGNNSSMNIVSSAGEGYGEGPE